MMMMQLSGNSKWRRRSGDRRSYFLFLGTRSLVKVRVRFRGRSIDASLLLIAGCRCTIHDQELMTVTFPTSFTILRLVLSGTRGQLTVRNRTIVFIYSYMQLIHINVKYTFVRKILYVVVIAVCSLFILNINLNMRHLMTKSPNLP